MEGKDHIIQLGKVLRAEYDRDCDDGAATGGLERFLTNWRKEANGALQHEQVQQALELLAGYGYKIDPRGVFDTDMQTIVRAFQLHFRQALTDGRLDRSTLDTLSRLAAPCLKEGPIA